MIELFVNGQNLTLATPVVAADSLNFLSVKAHFSDTGRAESWDGLAKYVHFRRGEYEYSFALDEHNFAPIDTVAYEDTDDEPQGPQPLVYGEWIVYVTGSYAEEGSEEQIRATTVPAVLTVKKSGLLDAPLHVLPLSVGEQLAAKLNLVYALYDDLARLGKLEVLGQFDTPGELANAVRCPAPGDFYAVGAEPPYELYMWDAIRRQWFNCGPFPAAQGDRGENGASFVPHITDGWLSWELKEDPTAGDLPASVRVVGERGPQGAPGQDGKDAYRQAAAQGYAGTESDFYYLLSITGGHHARHEAGGDDPITVAAGMLAAGAVTADKLAPGAVSAAYSATLTVAGWSGSGPYTQEVSVTGLTADDAPLMDLVMSGTAAADRQRAQAYAEIYRAVSAADRLTVYAFKKPETELPVRLLCVRK